MTECVNSQMGKAKMQTEGPTLERAKPFLAMPRLGAVLVFLGA